MLGVFHEQSRDDRDLYIGVDWGQIQSGEGRYMYTLICWHFSTFFLAQQLVQSLKAKIVQCFNKIAYKINYFSHLCYLKWQS